MHIIWVQHVVFILLLNFIVHYCAECRIYIWVVIYTNVLCESLMHNFLGKSMKSNDLHKAFGPFYIAFSTCTYCSYIERCFYIIGNLSSQFISYNIYVVVITKLESVWRNVSSGNLDNRLFSNNKVFFIVSTCCVSQVYSIHLLPHISIHFFCSYMSSIHN